MGWSEAELALIRAREGITWTGPSLQKTVHGPRPVGGPTVEDPEVWADPAWCQLRAEVYAAEAAARVAQMPVELMIPLPGPTGRLSYGWIANAEWHFGLVTGTSKEYHDAVFAAMERDRERP